MTTAPMTTAPQPLFVITLTYIRPLAEIDRLLADHRAYLQRYYAAGVFLLSGRQEPRVGGVIVARGGSREEVMRIIAEDPFFVGQVADYQVVEFHPTMAAPGLEQLKVPL